MLSPDTAYFVIATLLLLSIVTIGLCKNETNTAVSYSEFLFTGKTFFHSIVSSAGAVFSVTYLLGATFIYATIYRAWTFLMAAAVVGLAFLLVRKVICLATIELSPDPALSGRHNLLLRFMSHRLNKSNFNVFSRLLGVSFFLLLVEELSISRLVLSSAMRGLEPLGSILLFIIVSVVFAYLYIGGFRALINSDLVQGSVIAAFLAVLGYYVSKSSHSLITLAEPPNVKHGSLLAATILWTVYGAAFLMMAVDLFSRLNFTAPAHILARMRIRFVSLSLLLALIIVSAGIAFGLALSTEIGSLESASNYYSTVVAFFYASDTPAIRIIFIVGLFCMIFTTIDTLLLTVMQIRFYGAGLGSRHEDMSKVLLLAVASSVLVDYDAVCAFGIFVGSILMLPALQVLGELFPRIPFVPASNHRYLWFALGIATFAVVQFRQLFLENFEIHYAIPGVVLIASVMCGTAAVAFERLYVRRT